MSRAGVRTTVARFLSSPIVPGLTKVYRAAPTYLSGDDWSPSTTEGWGATSYVHINDHSETRIALGGEHGGIKQATYDTCLVVLFRWVIPDDAALDDGEPDGWADMYDLLIDKIVDRMRADRTFGSGPGGIVWQAGEGERDIHLQTDLPKIDNGTVVVWSALEFQVVEMLNT